MKTALLLLSLIAAGTAGAETVLPALHDVSGVAANDVLNIRQEPAAASPIIGQLAPGLTGVEVVGVSPDGKWGRVSTGEASGWASMAFLDRQSRPNWFTLEVGLSCSGTEPFWSLNIDRLQKTAQFTTPDGQGPQMDITTQWRGDVWRQVAAIQFAGGADQGFATIRAEACSDGMSDRDFGLRTDVFLQGTPSSPARALRGCCSLVP